MRGGQKRRTTTISTELNYEESLIKHLGLEKGKTYRLKSLISGNELEVVFFKVKTRTFESGRKSIYLYDSNDESINGAKVRIADNHKIIVENLGEIKII